MRQIVFRQVWKFSRLLSWNNTNNKEVVRPNCNGNLNSHIVPKKAFHMNVVYKYGTQTIYSEESLSKTTADARNKVICRDVEIISIFTLLIKLMKSRLNDILTKVANEPQSIFEYVSWKLRELFLSAIITTGVNCPDPPKASNSYLQRCLSGVFGHFFLRYPMFSLEQAIRTSLSRITTRHNRYVFKTQCVKAAGVAKFCSNASDDPPPISELSGASGSAVETRSKLIKSLHKQCLGNDRKVTVVGAGPVGMAGIIAMLTQGVTNNIAIIDLNVNKLKGETLDLLHGSLFVNNPKIESSSDFAISKESKVCVITAGVRQKNRQTRLEILQNNAKVFKEVVPQLMKHCPDAVFIIGSNPVDILACVTWKISGLPKYRVIGSGTLLDSARFRFLIAQRLGIATTSIDAYVIGEHGNSMVPVWSGVNVAGVRLSEINPKIGTELDPEKWKDIHSTLLTTAYHVRTMKGFTSWAIGLSLAKIVDAVLTDSNRVYAVSTYVKDMQGIKDEVFLSLPSVLCREGVRDIIHQVLTSQETEQLHKSAKIMAKVLSDLKL